MKITHRIAFSPSAKPEPAALLAARGHAIAGPIAVVVLSADEYADLEPKLTRWRVGHLAQTHFTPAEHRDAHWSVLAARWDHGYPEPDDGDFGYLAATYDLSAYCSTCGVGARQNAPFRMTREPKWGKRGVLQLHWVVDEVFVTPDVHAACFEPHGVACRPVLDRRGRAELSSVVQLVAEERRPIRLDGIATETCGACGREKVPPDLSGFFPGFTEEPSAPIARTASWIGSVASAGQPVIVSAPIVKALLDSKVRGAVLTPMGARREGGRASPEDV